MTHKEEAPETGVRGFSGFLGMGNVSVVLKASASITPPRTPADDPTAMAKAGSSHADTINSYPTRAACCADLRNHAVRPMQWREWSGGLRRCCDS
jgi:hypothetical protein